MEEEKEEEKIENPASDMAYESTVDFPLFTITDSSPKKEEIVEETVEPLLEGVASVDDTEKVIETIPEKLVKKPKKERELLTIRTPGGKKMILASKSPRRKEILEDTGFKIQIISAQVEETSSKDSITDKIMDIARKKLWLLQKCTLMSLL